MNKHRSILTAYWRQYYPLWEVPAGFHVHHIKPRCTFKDQDDPRIDDPSNLIALHPDDHVAIHKCRGDKFVTESFIRIANAEFSEEHRANLSKAMKGKPKSAEHKRKLSEVNLGKVMPDDVKEKIRKGNLGTKKPCSEATRRKISKTKTGVPGSKHSEETKKRMSENQKEYWRKWHERQAADE